MELKINSTNETTSANAIIYIGVQTGVMEEPFEVVNIGNTNTINTAGSRITFKGPVNQERGLVIQSLATVGAMRIQGLTPALRIDYKARITTGQENVSLVALGTGINSHEFTQQTEHAMRCSGASGSIDIQLGNTKIFVPDE